MHSPPHLFSTTYLYKENAHIFYRYDQCMYNENNIKKYQIKIIASVGFLGYNKRVFAKKFWNYCFRVFRV